MAEADKGYCGMVPMQRQPKGATKKNGDSGLWRMLSGEAALKIGSFSEIPYTEHLVPPLPSCGHRQNVRTQAFTPRQNTQGFLSVETESTKK